MEIVKFDRVVSVNSEVQGHTVQNILDGEISPSKNWMCEKGTEKAVVILQLDKPVVITSVHVGNAHSAFVEILVGKAADSSDQFESLVPMSVLMPPNDSKTGTNPNKTRFFIKSDFNEATAAKAWDRIKVVCSQPFNKYVPYGLCFLKVYGEKKPESAVKNDDEEIQVGSFFKKKRSSKGNDPLTVSEQIKEAEKEASLSKHTPISIAKISEKMSSDKKLKTKVEKPKDKTPKRIKDENTEEVKPTKRKKNEEPQPKTKKRKPFEKLMEDVVLVISGFKNPLRGDIRSMALKMGAKYSADWEPHCTHLVCAYENTPKFQQVKGKGKIVRKDWVEKCHKDRKRYPWRRYALDKTDLKKPESEEEIDEGDSELEDQVAGSSKDDGENVRSRLKSKSDDGDYDVATDDEEEKITDTTDYPMPYLPDIFASKTFYVDPSLHSRAALERYIIAYNGSLQKKTLLCVWRDQKGIVYELLESGESINGERYRQQLISLIFWALAEHFDENIAFYVTEKGGAPLDLFRKKAPNLVAIKPSWIWEINSKQKCIPTTLHLVK